MATLQELLIYKIVNSVKTIAEVNQVSNRIALMIYLKDSVAGKGTIQIVKEKLGI